MRLEVLSDPNPYSGRTAVLATMHGKEAAIAPPLVRRLGLQVIVPEGLDTDRLGTFSGEVKRPGTMAETAIAKARMAMAASGTPVGLASEGSFGPHPHYFFIPADMELMVLVNAERDVVIAEHRIDVKTNFGHTTVGRDAGLDGFLTRVGFPSGREGPG